MLQAFRAHGAATVSSDEIVHHLLRSDPAVKAALVERFGERILGDDGIPDRSRIAAIVFDDSGSLAFSSSSSIRSSPASTCSGASSWRRSNILRV